MRYLMGAFVLVSALNNYALTGTVEGNVSAKDLLAWFDAQKAIPANMSVQANGKSGSAGTGFCGQCSDDNSKPTNVPKTISLYMNSAAVFLEADMDIDCDGTSKGI